MSKAAPASTAALETLVPEDPGGCGWARPDSGAHRICRVGGLRFLVTAVPWVT